MILTLRHCGPMPCPAGPWRPPREWRSVRRNPPESGGFRRTPRQVRHSTHHHDSHDAKFNILSPAQFTLAYISMYVCIPDNVIIHSMAKSTYTERAQRTSRSSNPPSRNRETQYPKTAKAEPSHHPPRDHTALKPQVRTQPS